MKTIIVIILVVISIKSYGQNNTDTLDNKITTIKKERTLKGTIIEFCNGLSLDFGEHPGLLIIKENKTNKVFNVLLNPYHHYDFKKNEPVKIKIAPFSGSTSNKEDLQAMCKSIGNLFVEKKE